ncbi:Phosphinothricin acetyltransferase YwnH [Corynebacterium kutscheri]|uniref:Phosphinothricin acetyltransferase YwnH n=1 Tax=Corynebacterium kutscheri TaxID=35755 RepID=A0A0F6TDJ2_9CORY|nr:GNAT family N-acetyltransferase [Corynebacterium kutscheri]AKE41766.1 sortase-like acyltransferase [Corynebacterium kutscheri]VEH09041.1 Phosphinothricin acetyltransferase YwnH [Corynebacterium kutscheri]VEH10092.1 Phosphinothricin acetyltransferase YwnH [Corynebacterium kutscheri]VEH80174.1 Phosphinothricin acetyltransferase YwnH [Corynebacterium kutscheri]
MSDKDFVIRPLQRSDFGQVQQIYLLGLETGHATYEVEAPSWEKFSATKILETLYVAVETHDNNKVIGWVAAAPISTRSVFHGVVEDSIYIHPDARGRGVAGALLDKLIEVCQGLEKWAIHSWIFPENDGSAKLHISRGFEKVGTFSHLAKMTYGELAGQWRSTEVYEKLLPKPEIDDETAAALV